MARTVDDSEFIKAYDIKEHKFMTMEAEKRQRVIDAALKEFSKGFTAANTDLIVKEAGISKGLLFHYFGSKRGLFLFLIKYASDIIITEYEKAISASADFLENIRNVSKRQIELSYQYPLLFGILVRAYSSANEVFPEGLPGDLVNSVQMGMRRVCERSNNDQALFKESIDIEKAQNLIIWTVSGLTDSQAQRGYNVDDYQTHGDELEKGLEAYLQFLRKILYR